MLFPQKPNLLYKILLREEKKSITEYHALILQLPFILILIPISLVVVPLFWMVGYSGTIELVFKKT